MKKASIFTFAALLPFAILPQYSRGRPLAIIGVLSVICGILYTGGPKPLGYLGLGDILVLVFFGPVAVWGNLLCPKPNPKCHPRHYWSGSAAISTAILVVNNLRDKDGPMCTLKRTLAVRFGARFARIRIHALPCGRRYYSSRTGRLQHGPWAASAALLLIPAVSPLRSMYRIWARPDKNPENGSVG